MGANTVWSFQTAWDIRTERFYSYLTINIHLQQCSSDKKAINAWNNLTNNLTSLLFRIIYIRTHYVLLKMYEYSRGEMAEESQSSPTQLLWQIKEGRWEEFHSLWKTLACLWNKRPWVWTRAIHTHSGMSFICTNWGARPEDVSGAERIHSVQV